MLRVIAYIWAVFGAYWIIFASALGAKSPRQKPLQQLQLGFLAVTFLLLLREAHRIHPVWIIAFGTAWAMLGLYCVAPRKEACIGESGLYRLLRLIIGTIVFALLFWQKTGIAFLGERFVWESSAIAILGFVATLIGLAITAWARIHLGRYWSDKVAIQSDHNLVRTGPYVRLRHPIYSGVLLGIAGTALIVGEWRALLALLIASINYMIKAKREDRILAERFGDEFLEYQRSTGMLFPRLRRQGDNPGS